MKNIFKQSTSIILTVIVSSLVVAGIVYAGNLTAPAGTPSAQSYTLGDIYARLTTNASATAGNHSLSTTTSPASSFYTLSQIYSAIPTIDPTKILTGTSYLGVGGTTYPSAPLMTNQTTCYDNSGNPISCAGTGQDGQYQKGVVQSYTDNGDGTITDNSTGLMWQQCSDGTDCTVPNISQVTFSAAVSYCTSLTLGAHNDWRVPNINELLSLVDYSNPSSAINRTYFPDTDVSGNNPYWTSTVYASDPSYLWFVLFGGGYTYPYHRTLSNDVRCVRG